MKSETDISKGLDQVDEVPEIEQLKAKVAELELQNEVLLGYIQKMASHLNIEALLL